MLNYIHCLFAPLTCPPINDTSGRALRIAGVLTAPRKCAWDSVTDMSVLSRRNQERTDHRDILLSGDVPPLSNCGDVSG